MASKEKDIELIERFLDGLLSDEELREFENRRESDSEFKKKVEEMSYMIGAIKDSARESLMDELRELEAGLPEVEIEEEKTRSSKIIELGAYKIRKVYWRASQSVALAATLAGLFFGIGKPFYQSAQITEQFRDHQTPLKNLGLENYRGKTSEPVTFEEAEKAYIKDRYRKAIRLISKIENRSEAEWMILGNSYFQKKRFKKAAECFDLDNFGTDSDLMKDAKFSLALSYLAISNKHGAILLLEQLVQTNGNFAYEAGEILKGIKQN